MDYIISKPTKQNICLKSTLGGWCWCRCWCWCWSMLVCILCSGARMWMDWMEKFPAINVKSAAGSKRSIGRLSRQKATIFSSPFAHIPRCNKCILKAEGRPNHDEMENAISIRIKGTAELYKCHSEGNVFYFCLPAIQRN